MDGRVDRGETEGERWLDHTARKPRPTRNSGITDITQSQISEAPPFLFILPTLYPRLFRILYVSLDYVPAKRGLVVVATQKTLIGSTATELMRIAFIARVCWTVLL